MQAVGRPPQRAPGGAPLQYERHRPEQTTLYRLVQQHAASFIAQTEANTGSELPRFIKDEFDAFLECGILAHAFLTARGGECGRRTRTCLPDPQQRHGVTLAAVSDAFAAGIDSRQWQRVVPQLEVEMCRPNLTQVS